MNAQLESHLTEPSLVQYRAHEGLLDSQVIHMPRYWDFPLRSLPRRLRMSYRTSRMLRTSCRKMSTNRLRCLPTPLRMSSLDKKTQSFRFQK